jgi:hypothetical protein
VTSFTIEKYFSLIYDGIPEPDRTKTRAAFNVSVDKLTLYRQEHRALKSDGGKIWLKQRVMSRKIAEGEISWDGLAIN